MDVGVFIDKLKRLEEDAANLDKVKKHLLELDEFLKTDTINTTYKFTYGLDTSYTATHGKITILEYLAYSYFLNYELANEVAKLAIAKGADPNIHSKQGESLVLVACARDNIKLANTFINGGADINVQYGINKLTPLMEIIVSKPTYPPQYYNDDTTPSYDTSEKISYMDIFLSSNKIDINLQNANGQDVFMYAIAVNKIVEAEFIHQSIYQYSLDYDYNKKDSSKDTVLFLAINAYNAKYHNTFFSNALISIIEVLIKEPAVDLEITDRNDDTPLFLACTYENPEVVELFFINSARLPKIDAVHKKYNQTALNKAVAKGNLGVVEVLLKNSASTEIPDIEGDTPLITAVDEGNIGIIRALLEAGASKDTKNKEGKSALDLAKESKSKEVQDLFDINVPLWKGSSRSDITRYDTLFEAPFEWSTCPICLDYVERSSGCMFIMDHDCAKTGHYYHRELYKKYVSQSPNTGEPMIEWCTVCGRITEFHKHYKLVSANSDKPNYAPTKPDLQRRIDEEHDNTAFYDNTNCIGFGGGGLEEKASRFRRLREYALELQDDISKKTHKAAMKELIEETWNAPFYKTKKVREILEQKKYNISASNFPEDVHSAPKEPVESPEGTDIPYTGNLPLELDSATHSCVIGISDHEGEELNPVYNFKHLDRGGLDHAELLICKDDLTDAIKDKVKQFGTSRFGKCWVESCNAVLHPAELENIIPPIIYEEYRKKFNKKMAHIGGSIRKKSTTRKKKYSTINVLHALDLSTITCLNPPVKRLTLKSKKSSKPKQRSKKLKTLK